MLGFTPCRAAAHTAGRPEGEGRALPGVHTIAWGGGRGGPCGQPRSHHHCSSLPASSSSCSEPACRTGNPERSPDPTAWPRPEARATDAHSLVFTHVVGFLKLRRRGHRGREGGGQAAFYSWWEFKIAAGTEASSSPGRRARTPRRPVDWPHSVHFAASPARGLSEPRAAWMSARPESHRSPLHSPPQLCTWNGACGRRCPDLAPGRAGLGWARGVLMTTAV